MPDGYLYMVSAETAVCTPALKHCSATVTPEGTDGAYRSPGRFVRRRRMEAGSGSAAVFRAAKGGPEPSGDDQAAKDKMDYS